MNRKLNLKTLIAPILIISILNNISLSQKTIAFWPFDEPEGIYPSSVLNDLSNNDYPMVLGLGAIIVKGKFGNALDPSQERKLKQDWIIIPEFENEDKIKFGLNSDDTLKLSWFNAYFSAFMTTAENHLRKKVRFANPTKTKLNLGNFDWTLEFWFKPIKKSKENGTVFEIGAGERGKTKFLTWLKLNINDSKFIFFNYPSKLELSIPTKLELNLWQHIVFIYDSKNKKLNHYVNGKLISSIHNIVLQPLPESENAYMIVGRNGVWKEPLQGPIDELRFSEGIVYKTEFLPPKESFSYVFKLPDLVELKKGPELLLANKKKIPVDIGNRKYLFIDDAILELMENCNFVVNPPKKAEIVMTDIKGPFRKHLTVIEDENGKIRLYTAVDDDRLAVWISDDGINFKAPDLPWGKYKSHNNIVLNEEVGTGVVFIDPNSPENERWKYISNYNNRAIFVYYSKDGLKFERYKQPVIPIPTGSQINIFYDNQKQVYSAYLRSDYYRTKTGSTERSYLYAETKNLIKPWNFKPLTEDEFKNLQSKLKSPALSPWYFDNGPLSPPGLSAEYPIVFTNIENFDPENTDIYIAKALKYPWAEDTYIAFPVVYFHYKDAPEKTRSILYSPERKLGSGPLETQLAVSRDGIHWRRYPRPAYVGIGEHLGIDFKTAYIAYGMIKRGNEIWQYCFCEPHYHSPWIKYDNKRAIIRLVQRIDGFVSLDSPYDKTAVAITKPIIFKGKKLILNVDTDATGYVQVGFLNINNTPINGFSVDNCIYINGDFIEKEVEWIDKGFDLSELEGKPVKLVFKMRGAKLYSFQFK